MKEIEKIIKDICVTDGETTEILAEAIDQYFARQQKINNEVLADKCDEMDRMAKRHEQYVIKARENEYVKGWNKGHQGTIEAYDDRIENEHKINVIKARINELSKKEIVCICSANIALEEYVMGRIAELKKKGVKK